MKKIYFLVLAIVVIFVSSCQENEQNDSDSFKYKILVVKNEIPAANATLMCILSDTEENIIKCDKNGIAVFTSNRPIKLVVAMSPGASGFKKDLFSDDKENKINLNDVLEKPLVSTKYIGTFGVYSTDGAGDVKFRYQGSFVNFYCSSSLPWLLTTNNPNEWTSWSLTDFSPWSGKKLLVPTRYQQYHQTVLGSSISSALFLTANI